MPVGLKEPVNVECVNGIRLAATAAGIRYQNRNDLVLIELSEQTQLAAVFTRNKFRAAPVTLAIQNLSKAKPRYLIINAGNANANEGNDLQVATLVLEIRRRGRRGFGKKALLF